MLGPQMARTILVVEDEPTLRETLVDALAADGFRVVAAADGREALSQFRAERPDLVLLDLMLPELSGIEVTRIIRAESGVPIVMLTAKDSELDKVVGLELGADDYVTKPFDTAELLARVRVIQRRSLVETGEPVFEVGPLCVDLSARRVTLEGAEVKLTPTEYALLRALVQHAGKVVTHKHLLRTVWGEKAETQAQYLRVYITYLRRKLEPLAKASQLIKTEVGIGYRLATEI